mgnify:CR=1 FL=1
MYLRTSTLVLTVLGAGLLFLATPSVGWAQQSPQLSALTSPQIKEYGRPGYPKITVYVWGNADTGVWNVEEGTGLLEFVSVISRVQFGNQRPESRNVQTLRIYRADRTDKDPFFESRVEKLFTERTVYPSLKDGDILVLETNVKNRFSWRLFREIISTAAILLNTYLLLDRLND